VTNLSLDSTARLVSLQFSFSNPAIIPNNIRKRQQETKTESNERKQRSGGIMAIEPCENVSIEEFVSNIESSGYTLVDGLYQSRQDVKQPAKMYHMVRFIFAHNEFVEMNDEFADVRPKIWEELRHISETAFWRVRAFSNPFYKNGEEILGFRALSFNFEARIPRLLPDGTPVVQRRKDADGRKIGEPVSIEPAHHLVIQDNAVTLTD
jgi:hypothetical protein